MYVHIDQGIHKVKLKVAQNEKPKWAFLYIRYSKFLSVLLEHFIERKPLMFSILLMTLLPSTQA